MPHPIPKDIGRYSIEEPESVTKLHYFLPVRMYELTIKTLIICSPYFNVGHFMMNPSRNT